MNWIKLTYKRNNKIIPSSYEEYRSLFKSRTKDNSCNFESCTESAEVNIVNLRINTIEIRKLRIITTKNECCTKSTEVNLLLAHEE